MQSKLSAWTQYNLGCNNTKMWTIKSLAPTHTYPVRFVIKFKGNFTTKPLWEGGVERWSFLSSLRMLLCPAEHRLASGAFWTRWSWRSSPTLMIPKPTSPCNRGNDVARPEEDKARQLNPPGHSPQPHQGQLSPRGAAHLFSAPRGTAQDGTAQGMCLAGHCECSWQEEGLLGDGGFLFCTLFCAWNMAVLVPLLCQKRILAVCMNIHYTLLRTDRITLVFIF